jgi:DNA-binding FadR family transcriptional regulator
MRDLMQVSSKALQEQNARQAARRAKRDDAARIAAFNQQMLEAEESEPTYESYGFNSQEEMDAFDKNPKAGY